MIIKLLCFQCSSNEFTIFLWVPSLWTGWWRCVNVPDEHYLLCSRGEHRWIMKHWRESRCRQVCPHQCDIMALWFGGCCRTRQIDNFISCQLVRQPTNIFCFCSAENGSQKLYDSTETGSQLMKFDYLVTVCWEKIQFTSTNFLPFFSPRSDWSLWVLIWLAKWKCFSNSPVKWNRKFLIE